MAKRDSCSFPRHFVLENKQLLTESEKVQIKCIRVTAEMFTNSLAICDEKGNHLTYFHESWVLFITW